MTPSYLQFASQEIRNRAEEARAYLRSCKICPRLCDVNRLEDEYGFCGAGRHAQVANFAPHFGEEPPLVGRAGSGTIFFAGCNLKCVFCQNFDISHLEERAHITFPKELANMMLSLQREGVHNINFVTPSHLVPQILEALPIAMDHGLNLPLVYNTGTHDFPETLQWLEGIVDIYMPDLKFADSETASKYCDASDYYTVARGAVREMHRQTGDLKVNADGIAEQGVMIRHLILPHELADSETWFKFLAEEISKETYVNIMVQYHPEGKAFEYTELQDVVSFGEVSKVRKQAEAYGLHRFV